MKDHSKHYKWHKSYDHETKECYQPRYVIESLIKEGRLQKYIVGIRNNDNPRIRRKRRRSRSPRQGLTPHQRRRNRSPTRKSQTLPNRDTDNQQVWNQDTQNGANGIDRLVSTISRGFVGKGSSSNSRKKGLQTAVLSVSGSTRRPRADDRKEPPISFTTKDYSDIIRVHNEPLVISGIISNSEVWRIFIDQGNYAW